MTGQNRRKGWIRGMRLIVRRVKPSGRYTKDLTAFEKKTGWKYSITATNRYGSNAPGPGPRLRHQLATARRTARRPMNGRHHPDEDQEGADPREPWEPGAAAATREDLTQHQT
ncbi:hypothetical protein [Streptomyces sp. NPDC127084]|uniref:hypothetical protein n=1 Tax=Streptomyces sp. NPDC127084 TaxID=3347133 RepID=UPI00365E0DB8